MVMHFLLCLPPVGALMVRKLWQLPASTFGFVAAIYVYTHIYIYIFLYLLPPGMDTYVHIYIYVYTHMIGIRKYNGRRQAQLPPPPRTTT